MSSQAAASRAPHVKPSSCQQLPQLHGANQSKTSTYVVRSVCVTFSVYVLFFI